MFERETEKKKVNGSNPHLSALFFVSKQKSLRLSSQTKQQWTVSRGLRYSRSFLASYSFLRSKKKVKRAYRSFRSWKFQARGVRKVTTGIIYFQLSLKANL